MILALTKPKYEDREFLRSQRITIPPSPPSSRKGGKFEELEGDHPQNIQFFDKIVRGKLGCCAHHIVGIVVQSMHAERFASPERPRAAAGLRAAPG
jgi:hypothetical protein